ncbi:hypothetical protein BSNT_09956 [Bacillus subtilis subsp. natto BEST195]|nr:hypothetical protein BSNT_09956 [Bacillus subtilis subsp. natto BEST195]
MSIYHIFDTAKMLSKENLAGNWSNKEINTRQCG